MPIIARSSKRDAPRGKILPLSAFVLLFIYAVVQLQSDIPSRWTSFLRLGTGIFATPDISVGGNEAVVGNVGTEVPIAQQQKTVEIKEIPIQKQDSGAKSQDTTVTIDIGSTTTAAANSAPEEVLVEQPKESASKQLEATAEQTGTDSSEQPGATTASELVVARQTFDQKCTEKREEKYEVVRKDIEDHLAQIFKPPSKIRKLASEDPVQPCQNAFIDLGANVGDSMGKLIDSGFPSQCPNYGRVSHARYNLTSGVLELGRGNQLINFARNAMSEVGRRPEDYCYVGVEGNPVFTERLRELEARVMDTTPKPLQAAHFYTESVGAGEDGPTFLYLDTVNTANNFWGSSIISTHQDAKKSAAANGNVTVKAPVTGLTLSTLLKRSVIRAKGSHVIIKIDIEGGEYVVINEAIDTLCDFTSAGVLVHLMMETHSPRVTGGYNADMRKYQAETSKRIPQCNISTGALAGGDH